MAVKTLHSVHLNKDRKKRKCSDAFYLSFLLGAPKTPTSRQNKSTKSRNSTNWQNKLAKSVKAGHFFLGGGGLENLCVVVFDAHRFYPQKFWLNLSHHQILIFSHLPCGS